MRRGDESLYGLEYIIAKWQLRMDRGVRNEDMTWQASCNFFQVGNEANFLGI